MRKFILLHVSCLCLFLVSGISADIDINKNSREKNQLIILTYNVHQCEGLDNKTDFQRVADIILRINPRIVALQELDSATRRSNGIIVLNELAARTNMYPIYAPYFAFDGGKYGIGILSKEKPVKWESVLIPGRIENRLLIVELENLMMCCTHFSGNEEAKLKSVMILNDLFKESSKPVFFAGDLNSVPESKTIKSLEDKWIMLNDPTEPTAPSDNPESCIDYIFVLKNSIRKLKIKQIHVEKNLIASDHCPVWVRVTINIHPYKIGIN